MVETPHSLLMLLNFLYVFCSLQVVIAQALDPFILGSFVKAATFSVANQLGFFTDQGLNVTFSQIPNSTFGYANLLAGGYDMLIGTSDNVVNRRFNSNESFTIVGQLDLGPDIVIAAVPEITSVLDLKGKSLMVDAPDSGYAFLLEKMLSLFGLHLNTDYTFQVVGGTLTRFSLLSNGSLPDGTPTFATILTYPFTVLASNSVDPPFPILARASDFVAPFFSDALTVRSSDASPTNTSSPLIRAVAALLAANRFLADPSNQACATSAIAAESALSADIAALEYTSATNPVSGETSQTDFEVGSLGLFNVIDIRMLAEGFGGAGTSFDFVNAVKPGAGQMIDDRVRIAALQIVKDPPQGNACILDSSSTVVS